MITAILTTAGTEALKKVIGLMTDRLNARLSKGASKDDLIALYRSLGDIEKAVDDLGFVLGVGDKGPLQPVSSIADVLQDANVALGKLASALERLAPSLEIFAPEMKQRIQWAHASEADVVGFASQGAAVVDDLAQVRSLAATAKHDVGEFIRSNYTFKEIAP
jgi:hypothetical protein